MDQTAAQAKADNIAKMGGEIGATYSALWQEVAWIHKKWSCYIELFGTGPDRIELMNRAAPSFFRTVQDALWENVILHLARLTDSPKSKGRCNLSVRHLAQLVDGTPAARDVQSLTTAALAACEFARDWRNRRIAHRDLELALGQNAHRLKPASRAAVKTALVSLGALLNSVSEHFTNSTTGFGRGSGGEDAVSLLYILRDGLDFEADRIARVKRGELPLSALKPKQL